jgi:hypothetical protein
LIFKKTVSLSGEMLGTLLVQSLQKVLKGKTCLEIPGEGTKAEVYTDSKTGEK